MSSDYDKQQWQIEQAQRDAVLEKQRDKERKTRERAARNVQRKLARLHRTLSEHGDITEFEDEFGQSVLERLDKFGSAFHDLEKGRPGDALSFAQRSVVAAMNKKVKSLKKTAHDTTADNGVHEDDFEDGYIRTADRWKNQNAAGKQAGKPKRASFGSKKTPKFTPNVRHIEDDFEAQTAAPENISYAALAPKLKNRVPYLPQYISGKGAQSETPRAKPSSAKTTASGTTALDATEPKTIKPFLRLVT